MFNINITKYFKILEDTKIANFATIDKDGKPTVRNIDIMFVEEEKIFFTTARGKEFYKEIEEQKYVSVSSLSDDYEMIRFSGYVQKEDKSLLDRIFKENYSLKFVYPRDTRNILEVFSIYKGEGEYFHLEDPINRERFSFGGEEVKNKDYKITDNCTQCGLCKTVCPQNCIVKGNPYEIVQKHCLHCGACSEICASSSVF